MGTVICPAHGMVSVWKSGAVPSRLTSKMLPWVLVRGPQCSVVRLWDSAPAFMQAAGDTRAEGLGIEIPSVTWKATGHAWLDTWIATVAAAYGCPHGVVGVLCLGALSAALTSKLRVDMYVTTPKGRGKRWSEPIAALFTMVIAPSGLRKSPLLEHLMRPWRELQKVKSADARRIEAAWKIRISRAQKVVDKLSRKDPVATAAGYQDDALIEAQVAVGEPPPRAPNILVSNATGPALAEEMCYEPQVVYATAEASEIFKALQKEDGAELEPMLKGYSGEPPGGVLRISRKQPNATALRCSVVALTQPSGLYGVGESLSTRGQGLFARFLWLGVDKSADCEGVIEDDLQRGWDARIIALTRRSGPTRDAWGVESGEPTYICATPEQTAKALALESRLRKRLEKGGDLYGIDTWARKAHGQAMRIAAVLSSMDKQTTTIEDRFLDWALYMVEHVFLIHAQYVAQLMSWPPGTDDAVHLHTVAQTYMQGHRGTFALTELDRWVPTWHTEQTDTALNALANRGYVTIQGRARAERLVTFRK